MDTRDTANLERWWTDTRGRRAQTPTGEWVDVEFAVCHVCAGTGSHVNPAIDSHGITAEQFDEDPDFRDAYFAGVYDVPCNLCRGARVIPVPTDASVRAEVDETIQDAFVYEYERPLGV